MFLLVTSAPFPNQTTVLSWWHVHSRMIGDNWLIYSDPQCIVTRQLPSPKSLSYFWDVSVCVRVCSDGKYLWTDKKHKGGRETEREISEREKWEQARGHWDKQRQPKEDRQREIDRQVVRVTHLASSARAMIPAASGAEAEVPVWVSVHFCLRSVVTWQEESLQLDMVLPIPGWNVNT